MTYQGTRRRPHIIMVSAVLLSLGVGIGSGIGIGFGIFHTPNPCDGMKLSNRRKLKRQRSPTTKPPVWASLPTGILSN